MNDITDDNRTMQCFDLGPSDAATAAASVLELLEVPAGKSVEMIIVGAGTPDHDDVLAVYIHFEPFGPEDYCDPALWRERADAHFTFRGPYFYFDELIKAVVSRWPDAIAFDFCCTNCSDEVPVQSYVNYTLSDVERVREKARLATIVERQWDRRARLLAASE